MVLAPDKIPSIFQDPPWLGFKHNGYPVAPLNQYGKVRGVESPKAYNHEYFAMLQSAMSFGLIEAVIDCPLREDKLLRTREDGRQALCLEYLPELLAPWVGKARAEGESLTAERERVYTSLHWASTTLLRLTERLRDLRLDYEEAEVDLRLDYEEAEVDKLPAMFCTLGCIGETLTRARGCLYPDSNPGGNFSWDLVIAHQVDCLLDDACAVGWCRSDVNYVLSLGISSARFFFRRPPVHRAGDEDHSQCTIAGCALIKLDVNNYVAQHMVEGCKCSHTKPPLDLVVQLINSGTNPVMTLPKDEFRESGSRIEVADGSTMPYIAISHVWAHGLGGNTETGLPECQVKRLLGYAKMFGTCAFWQDALCVPELEENPNVRKKALTMMGRAYRDAKLVIVLDKTLQSVSLKSPVKDILSYIFISPWMRRMWTFQEAALAKSVHFQLLDGMLSLSQINRLIDDDNLYTDDALASMLQEVLRLGVRCWQKMSLCDVAHALKWRFTNRPSDEIPAIVSLLDVNVDTVLSVSLEQRMASMLFNLRIVPRDLPFLAAPKLNQPCFKWAPATFMSVAQGNMSTVAMSNLSQTAEVTPEGLVAEYLVCEIDVQEFSKDETWTLVHIDSKQFFYIASVSENAGNFRCNFLLIGGSSMPSKLTKCLAVLGKEGTIPSSGEPAICCTYVTKLALLGHRPPYFSIDNRVVLLKHIPSVRKVMIS